MIEASAEEDGRKWCYLVLQQNLAALCFWTHQEIYFLLLLLLLLLLFYLMHSLSALKLTYPNYVKTPWCKAYMF